MPETHLAAGLHAQERARAHTHTHTHTRARTHTRIHMCAESRRSRPGLNSLFGACTRSGTVDASGEGGSAEGGTNIDDGESAVSHGEQHIAYAIAPAHIPAAPAAAVEVIPDSSDDAQEAERDVRPQGEAGGGAQEYEMVVTEQLDPTFPPATAGGCFEPSEFQVRASKRAAVFP